MIVVWAGCYRSAEVDEAADARVVLVETDAGRDANPDAIPPGVDSSLDASASNDASAPGATDATVDGSGLTDASTHACYPISAASVSGNVELLLIGESQLFESLGFTIDAADVSRLPSVPRLRCDPTVQGYFCYYFTPFGQLVTDADYDLICAIDAAVSARDWVVILGE